MSYIILHDPKLISQTSLLVKENTAQSPLSHAIAISPSGQATTECLTLEHSAEALHQWLDQLEQKHSGRQIAIAIEATKGAVVHALLERPWITIYPIHPATSTRHRTMFRPSGAADDMPDALVLLSLLQHHLDAPPPTGQ